MLAVAVTVPEPIFSSGASYVAPLRFVSHVSYRVYLEHVVALTFSKNLMALTSSHSPKLFGSGNVYLVSSDLKTTSPRE